MRRTAPCCRYLTGHRPSDWRRSRSVATVGEQVRIPFQLGNALTGTATISNRSGIVFSREYLLRQGTGVVKWTPEQAGTAVLRIRARGHQGQTATKRLRHHRVAPARTAGPAPSSER